MTHTPAPWGAVVPKSRHIHDETDITHYSVMTEKTRGQLRDEGFHHYNEDVDYVDNIDVVSHQFVGDMTLEEAISNAHLIAAAPELLDFCERMQEHYAHLLENDSHLIDELDETIKKARG